jgi:O-acetyl-ADP-ribose deacetylase (regulator of RNase III)
VERAAAIAVRTVKELADTSGVERVLFCCFDQETANTYEWLLT